MTARQRISLNKNNLKPNDNDHDAGQQVVADDTTSTTSTSTSRTDNRRRRRLPEDASRRQYRRPRGEKQHHHRHTFSYSSSSSSQLFIAPKTKQAALILVVAIVAGMLWNWWFDNSVDPVTLQFWKQTCGGASMIFCHAGLVPWRRTLKAKRPIRSGETVLEIPRRFQIWDVDALQNPFVRQELFGARIRWQDNNNNNHTTCPLPSAAFLAAHVALLQHQIRHSRRTTANGSSDTDPYLDDIAADELDPILQLYLTQVLPTFDDYQQFHPLTWSDEYLADLLGTYTYTYTRTVAFRRLLHDEYTAFCQASSSFCQMVQPPAYFAARLNVMTRSFGTGELPHDMHPDARYHFSTTTTTETGHPRQPFASWNDEVAYYEQTAGITSLERGSHAMVPILDFYDHHAKPNVAFLFDAHKQAFVVSAVSPIRAGQEIMDSYGKRTDSDLFCRYGFVNGDGSGWTQASLALWHSIDVHPENVGRPHNNRTILSSPKERSSILRYLQYDDGYENCVTPPSRSRSSDTDNHDDSESQAAWEFKKLKYEYLLWAVALEESHWVFHMSPRDPLSFPALSTEHPITLQPPASWTDMRSLQFHGNDVFSTCRLLSLTHLDYHGNATAMLRQAIHMHQQQQQQAASSKATSSSSSKLSSSSALPPTRDGLEFRTQLCIARIASTALKRFGVSITEQQTLVAQLNRESYGQHNWTAAHLRLGEMQSLEMLKQLAFSGLRQLFGPDALDQERNDPAYTMRDMPCPSQNLRPLLKFV